MSDPTNSKLEDVLHVLGREYHQAQPVSRKAKQHIRFTAQTINKDLMDAMPTPWDIEGYDTSSPTDMYDVGYNQALKDVSEAIQDYTGGGSDG